MRYFILALTIAAASAQAANTDSQKAAQDLCDTEWNITDRASVSSENIADIVSDEISAFKRKGYSFSDFSIDETDFIKVSVEGAEGFRKMVKELDTPYPKAREFLHGRMMPVCMKNVTEILNKSK